MSPSSDAPPRGRGVWAWESYRMVVVTIKARCRLDRDCKLLPECVHISRGRKGGATVRGAITSWMLTRTDAQKAKQSRPAPGRNRDFSTCPPGSRISCQVGPFAPISFRLNLYNRCLEHPSQYSPARSAIRGSLPPPGVRGIHIVISRVLLQAKP